MQQSRAQAAIDMLVAYGVAILILSIVVYVIFQLGIFNTRLTPTYCNPAPSFACGAYAINKSGALTMEFSQSTGATLNITAAACSSQQATNSSSPRYGNVNVITNGPFYQSGQWNSIIVYSSNQTTLKLNCYGPSGIAKGQLGNGFTGFVWINYTISSLPGNYHSTEQIASISSKYT